jgi:hypothetical protein
LRHRAADVGVDAVTALEAAVEPVNAIRIAGIGRLFEVFRRSREIDRNSAAGRQTPVRTGGCCRRMIAASLVIPDCASKIDEKKENRDCDLPRKAPDTVTYEIAVRYEIADPLKNLTGQKIRS